ncbi:Hypothetical protein D9617_16g014810 [Elsinoe fawcettii]|nr:Hypothetical protein D9617_16g014810 [Elsinoe fawcettii]
MHTTRRPVPSKAALRALRQLAYVASGTACGAAAIVYEERRRRIHFFKQVADNGRVIRSFADKRRNHATAAALLQDYDAFDAVQHGSWHIEDPHPTQARRRRSRSRTLGDLEDGQEKSLRGSHDSFLPSQVERGYNHLSRKEFEKSAEGPIRSTASSKQLKSPHRRADKSQVGLHSEPRVLPLSRVSQTIRLAPEAIKDVSDRSAPSSKLEMAAEAVVLWSQRFENLRTPRTDLSQSWRSLLRAAAGDSDVPKLPVLEEPESAELMLRTSFQLKLPDLSLQICNWLHTKDMLKDLAGLVASELLAMKDSSMFHAVRDFVLGWIDQNKDAMHPAGLVAVRMQLIASGSRERAAAEFRALFEEAQLRPSSRIEDQAKSLSTKLMELGRPDRACVMVLAYIDVVDARAAESSTMADWLVTKFLSTNDRSTCRKFVATLVRKKYGATQELISKLWQSAQEQPELLNTFKAFGFEGIQDKSIVHSLCSAIINDGPRELAISELYGSRSRVWSGTLVRSWQGLSDAGDAVKEFWKVQHLVGDRPLDPVLYDSILRITGDANLSTESQAIEQCRKRVISETSNDATIDAIMQASRCSDWTATRSNIAKLKTEGFAVMPIQQRMQLFDPVFKAMATSQVNVKSIYLVALELCRRICPSPSPPKALRLLSSSLTRNGDIELLSRVRDMASELLERDLRLTPVDIAEALRCYYYTYRPSTMVLADLMRKLFQGCWSAASRFCIPLLLLSASYESKWNQQKRSITAIQDTLRDSLKHFDDPEFRQEILDRVSVPTTTGTSTDVMDTPEFGLRKKAGPLVYEITAAPKKPLLDDAQALEKEIEMQPSRLANDTTSDASLSQALEQDASPLDDLDKVLQEVMALDMDNEAPRSRSDRRSSYDHFTYTKTKALMHDANAIGDHGQTTALLEDLSRTNVGGSNPILASLGMASAASLSPELATALEERLEILGADSSLARLTKVISELQSHDMDQAQLNTEAFLIELKNVVSSEYQAHMERGHLVNHSLATALANVLLDAKQPAAAVELLRHALRLSQVKSDRVGAAPMLSLLKAYLQLGRMDGVRWVVATMFASDERLDKSFITALKAGRTHLEGKRRMPESKRQKIVEEIELVQKLCIEKKREQIEKSSRVGNDLVDYLIANGKQQSRGPEPKENSAWVDAKIVESVCTDILTISMRSHQKSKKPMSITHPEHLIIRKYFMGSPTMDGNEVEVTA